MQNKQWNYDKTFDRRDLGFKVCGITDWMDDWFKGFKFQNLGDLEKNLVDDIGRSHKLVFPCSGVFWYTNPRMTANGDLMCDVTYRPSGESFDNSSAPPRADPQSQPPPSAATVPVPGQKGHL